MVRAYAAFQQRQELKPIEYDFEPLGSDEVEIDFVYKTLYLVKSKLLFL
ncbi:hypothetical protein [Iningainema tapete]|uniref:Uncharacterized protein n=1 Tax=Iningainema tapete BLCC-T55 TaxID=2748662 RepID=A0A8J7BZL0_9CYAN|nr:hypothetical protein [Iningainema tapete]MBD2776133.1 hypothetical protein [Iningainema tapete BLCC-T55]